MRQKNFQEVHSLKNQQVGVNEISRRLGIRKATIIEWLSRDAYEDNRGWHQGRKRVYTAEEEDRIISIKQKMIARDDYFLGAPHVQMHYAAQYPKDTLPSKWFVEDVVRRNNLQTRESRKRGKGKNIVARLLFPIRSIIKLGRIHQAADFIGKKFITGRSEPISLFSTSYYQWLELYHVWRTLAETADSAIACLKKFWTACPIPNVLRIDNGMTFRGTGSAEAHIGRFMKFLLNCNVTPLFSAAYQSYTNPHIEGHNSTFTQKLWARHTFTSLEDIDHECSRFNSESSVFYHWKFKERLSQKSLRYLMPDQDIGTGILRSTKGKKIYFIRFVQRWSEEDNRYGVAIFNRFVPLPDAFNNQYVLAVLHLESATVHVYSERDGMSTEILHYPFPYTL